MASLRAQLLLLLLNMIVVIWRADLSSSYQIWNQLRPSTQMALLRGNRIPGMAQASGGQRSLQHNWVRKLPSFTREIYKCKSVHCDPHATVLREKNLVLMGISFAHSNMGMGRKLNSQVPTTAYCRLTQAQAEQTLPVSEHKVMVARLKAKTSYATCLEDIMQYYDTATRGSQIEGLETTQIWPLLEDKNANRALMGLDGKGSVRSMLCHESIFCYSLHAMDKAEDVRVILVSDHKIDALEINRVMQWYKDVEVEVDEGEEHSSRRVRVMKEAEEEEGVQTEEVKAYTWAWENAKTKTKEAQMVEAEPVLGETFSELFEILSKISDMSSRLRVMYKANASAHIHEVGWMDEAVSKVEEKVGKVKEKVGKVKVDLLQGRIDAMKDRIETVEEKMKGFRLDAAKMLKNGIKEVLILPMLGKIGTLLSDVQAISSEANALHGEAEKHLIIP